MTITPPMALTNVTCCVQGERKWRRCPICYESIHRGDLKRYLHSPLHLSPLSIFTSLPPPLPLPLYGSVMALSAPQYHAGDVITMRLMAREKVSLELLHTPEETIHHLPPLRALPTSSPAASALAHPLLSPLSMVHILTLWCTPQWSVLCVLSSRGEVCEATCVQC